VKRDIAPFDFSTDERAHVAEIAIVVVFPGAARSTAARLTDDSPIAEHRTNLVPVVHSYPPKFPAALTEGDRREEKDENTKRFFP
jgi:hypothetical protein